VCPRGQCRLAACPGDRILRSRFRIRNRILGSNHFTFPSLAPAVASGHAWAWHLLRAYVHVMQRLRVPRKPPLEKGSWSNNTERGAPLRIRPRGKKKKRQRDNNIYYIPVLSCTCCAYTYALHTAATADWALGGCSALWGGARPAPMQPPYMPHRRALASPPPVPPCCRGSHHPSSVFH
jgi:hypothetical protein